MNGTITLRPPTSLIVGGSRTRVLAAPTPAHPRRHHDRAGHDSQQRLLRSLLRLLERGQQFERALAPLAAPVPWLQGEDDPLVPEPQARAFVGRHPSWTYATRSGVHSWLAVIEGR